MIREVSAVAETERSSPLYANGRPAPVTLHITADGRPYANKEVQVIQSASFEVRGLPATALTLPLAVNEKLMTDDRGRASVTLNGPRVLPGRINPWADSRVFFPATGRLELRGQWDAAIKVEVTYEILNPFPVISRLTIPGNVDDENWQTAPSRIYITDPDSQSTGGWKITVDALGSLKSPKGPAVKRRLSLGASANPVEFYYRPPGIGLDPHSQPELARRFIEANLKVALNLIVGHLEGLFYSWPKERSRQAVPVDLETAYKAAKGALGYLDRVGEDDASASSGGEILMQGLDNVFNLTETALGLLGTSLGPDLEPVMDAYENALVFFSAVKNYERMAGAYQDVISLPLIVTVEDESGHRTQKAGTCAVQVRSVLP